MAIHVDRKNIKLTPDFTKVIPLFFNTGNERATEIMRRILAMHTTEIQAVCNQVLEEFADRYRDITSILNKHFEQVKHLLTAEEGAMLTEEKRMLIGAYFTMEYAIEAAALFNPSVVEDPDQSGVSQGEKKVIISFRATGENHISSLVFRRGVLDNNGDLLLDAPGKFMNEGVLISANPDDPTWLADKLLQLRLPEDIYARVLGELDKPFAYKEIDNLLKEALQTNAVPDQQKIKYEVLKLVDAGYEIQFPVTSRLSERVLFPVTHSEKKGIEDARFTRFTETDGNITYYATYTAYDGSFILPKMVETKDFRDFKISPLHGRFAVNKNLALFPRKINGRYAMLSRVDGVNNYLMLSDDIHIWDQAQLIQRPRYPWELVQMGNGGAPIETAKGWLVITHGVGPMRKYCLGASLLDLDDPSIELARLSYPLLIPNEDERNGYVPNVVYTCGAIVHEGLLFMPYAVSDYASSFATVPLAALLDELEKMR